MMNTGIEPGLISALGCPGNYVFFFAFPYYFSFLGADVLFLAAFCSLFSAFNLFFASTSEPKPTSSPWPESLPLSLGSESYSSFASFDSNLSRLKTSSSEVNVFKTWNCCLSSQRQPWQAQHGDQRHPWTGRAWRPPSSWTWGTRRAGCTRPSQRRRRCQQCRLLCSLLCHRIGWFHQTCTTLIFFISDQRIFTISSQLSRTQALRCVGSSRGARMSHEVVRHSDLRLTRALITLDTSWKVRPLISFSNFSSYFSFSSYSVKGSSSSVSSSCLKETTR